MGNKDSLAERIDSEKSRFKFTEEPRIRCYEIKEPLGNNNYRVYLAREDIETGKIISMTYICEEIILD